MRLILFGPPGAGKGTQAGLLKARLALYHLSTGDLFRAAMKDGTPVGCQARSYIEAGELVPDDVVWGVAREGLDKIGADRFILDGFPRTKVQARRLDEYLASRGRESPLVISLEIDKEVIVGRLSRRRIDTKTGKIYHLDFNPPPADIPATRIIQRPDDRPEAIRKRLRVYHKQTKPVKAHYQQKGRLVKVAAAGDIEVIYNRIMGVLNNEVMPA